MNGATVRPDGEGLSNRGGLTFQPVYALTRIQAQSLKMAMSYQLEGLSFLGRRLGKDVKLLQDLSTSRGTGEAIEACAEFCQDAFEDYSEEMAKLTRIGAEIIADPTASAGGSESGSTEGTRRRHDA